MLVIISTHPIQYQVPLWRKLAEAKGIDFEVWYLTDFGIKESYDVQFGKSFAWDIPMLIGYKHRFLKVNKEAAPNKGFYKLRLKENLKKLFIENKVTHVYINGWQVLAYWQALWAAKSLNLKTIFKGESNDLKPEIRWKWPFKKFLLSGFFNKVDYFLYIGSANKRLYLKHGITEKRLLPGYYCVDNARFKEASVRLKNSKINIRQKWNIPLGSFCILFAGKFIDKKRPLDIISAASSLSQKYPIHLLFVGSGELYESIKNECNVLYENGEINNIFHSNLKINISLVGFLNQSEIPEAYAVSDCLILPSNYNETWGLVVNEAMASGVPCIVSDQCGCAEDLIATIDENLVYPCGNTARLAESINHIINERPATEKIFNLITKYCYEVTIKSVKKILLS